MIRHFASTSGHGSSDSSTVFAWMLRYAELGFRKDVGVSRYIIRGVRKQRPCCITLCPLCRYVLLRSTLAETAIRLSIVLPLVLSRSQSM